MNKIAQYLNEHLIGEVASSKAIRRQYSVDDSILSITPEIVAFPRVTNDVRKIARFSWQLAEKGHTLGITTRGFGSDVTGAALGKGIVVDTTKYLHDVIHLSAKDRLAHVQPGIDCRTLHSTLRWHGLTITNLPEDAAASIGGIIASSTIGAKGTASASVGRLEIVLANGDTIETGRINKREVNQKKGEQTFEGEIYRKLDGIIDDNEELIRTKIDPLDSTGYSAIAQIRDKDGSYDLTPLFIGSQGTLGVISEAVFKLDFYAKDRTVVAVSFESPEAARDASDVVKQLEPSELMTLDGRLFQQAKQQGKTFALFDTKKPIGAVIYVSFNDFSERAQKHKLKKLKKMVSSRSTAFVSSADVSVDELDALKYVTRVSQVNDEDTSKIVSLISGAYVPERRHEDFSQQLIELGKKIHVDIPISVNRLTNIVYCWPALNLREVSGKQKILKLVEEYSILIDKAGGTFVADGGEGRLKANAAWKLLDKDVADLYDQVKKTFDPYGTLNPGVKQPTELKSIVKDLKY